VPPPAEAWLYVQTVKGDVALRVDGGPHRQDAAKFPARPPESEWVAIEGLTASARPIEGGKRVVYTEEMPETVGGNNKREDRRYRLMVAGAKGEEQTAVLTGLDGYTFALAADGKSAVCGAEKGGKWDVYRVAFDGTPPKKLSRTPGIACPLILPLPDGRVVYHAVTGWHVKQLAADTRLTSGEGPVLLIDGETETVLVKKTHEGLPVFTADAGKMAGLVTTATGEAAVEVTDRKAGTSAVFPVSAFNKNWVCDFNELRFSPDGKALAVTFGSAFEFLYGRTPAGHAAYESVGVVWLDGRKNPISLYHVEVLQQKHKEYPLIRSLEWGPPPVTR
jgi:hypothetical protein